MPSENPRHTRRASWPWGCLLVAVIVFCVLKFLAGPSFHTADAPIQGAKGEIASFTTAIEMYHVDTGGYPLALADLLHAPGGATNWRGPYLRSEVPLDPWEHEYIYHYPGTHTNDGFAYDLYSPGPPSPTNVIANWNTHFQVITNSR